MPTKKPAPKKVAPAKKATVKAAHKPVPTKVVKAVPAKKAAAKPVHKPAPAKALKVVPAKKVVAKPVPKKATSVPAKKAVPAKPAPKKTAPVPAKKAAPAKQVAAKQISAKQVPVKQVPSKQVKEVPKPVAKPVVHSKTVVPAKPAAKVVAKPVAPAPVPVKPAVPAAKPKIEVKGPPAPPVKPIKKQPEPIKDVKVPKINTKSSVPYKPGYTQLEKRVAELTASNGEPLIKYNDTDLNEFRDLIGKKLDAAKKELAYLQGLITRKDEMGGDNDDARYMTMEDGSMSMEREQLSQMASRQITYIDHLEKAMMRIENKTYGICRVTGKLIDKARLRAVPHATLSLEAKLGLVKTSEQ
ncbi:MAG: TraR/DksA C4-type zinc finger protein [Chitinophagaceae bacterium]|nr:TraR/DksA C4-type zinc finger protein [Chitinophagaceae bacterium]